ncbi:serine hydrolase [Tenacibaculum xiamenense]|uniref:serine hydrolase n=1 Tax=Tenacibaculum xiamenense TaxID=1261553 RepID=UPI0038B58F44
MKKVILSLIFTLSTVVITAQRDKRLKGIDKELNNLLKITNTPGFAIAVVEGDKVVYAKGFGYRDYENKIPVDANTLFAIGSTTKAFTSAILGKLRADKKVSFNDSPRKYIPELEFYNDDMNKNIIIKDLMRHSTGLPSSDFSWYFFPTYNKDSLLFRVKYQAPITGVRQQWHYNNHMFLAQGVLAEKITGKSWEENVSNDFFKPLNMTRSNATITEMKSFTNAAFGYQQENDGSIRKMDYQDIAGMAPAGSINSSVNDMAKWLITWINNGKYNNKEIIPSSYLNEAISPQMVMSSTLPSKNSPDIHFQNYGYGWNLSSYKGHYRVEHGGNLIGFTASVAFFPTDKVGIVVLSNQGFSEVPSLVRNIISDRMLNEKKTDWVKRYTNVQKRARELQEGNDVVNTSSNVKNTKPSHSKVDYVGNYYNPGYGKFKVFIKNDSLFMQTTDKTRLFYLNHYHYDTFEVVNVRNRKADTLETEFEINFRTNRDGAISEAMIEVAPALDAIAFKHTPKTLDLNTTTLKQYVGEYEISGMTLKVYTKNNSTTLYLFISDDQPEFELSLTAQHKFSFKISGQELKVEFKNVENNLFKELVLTQPDGVYKAVRK